MDYVAFTLVAMALISRLGERSRLELWNQRQGDGRNFQAAHDWLLKASNARALLSRIAAGAAADETAQDPGLLLDLGIKLRAFQRVAEVEGRAAARARAELTNAVAFQERQEAEVKLLRQQLDDSRVSIRKLSADREAHKRRLRTLEEERKKQDQRLKGLEQECETLASAAEDLVKDREAHKRRLRTLEEERKKQDQRLKGLEQECKTLASASEDLVKDREALLTYSHDLKKRYRAVLNSTSWLVTGPARVIARSISHLVTWRRPQRNDMPSLPSLSYNNAAGRRATTSHNQTEKARSALTLPQGATDAGATVGNDPFETMRNIKPRDEEALIKEYEESDLNMEPDSFVLYRIIGNDLCPRHKKGQSRENVRFILENEPGLFDCEKRWVINRIIDPDEERQIIAMLEASNQAFIHIPFVVEEYRKIGWDFDAMPTPGFLTSKQFQKLAEQLPQQLHDRGIAALYRLKNNYVMNNNGARNAALADGRGLAKWVLPWDGNCFITAKAWQEIHHGVTARPHLKYFVVPMDRVMDNAILLREDFTPHPVEEPQLLFRRDADEAFDPRISYGRRPKAELFWRLSIPGPWDAWRDDPWDQKRRALSPEAQQFGVVSWVARMFSGVEAFEQKNKESTARRDQARREAIITTIDHLDGLRYDAARDPDGLAFYPRERLNHLRHALQHDGPLLPLAARIVKDAELALTGEPFSVMEAMALAPNCDPHDYLSPESSLRSDFAEPRGTPYTKKNAQRAPSPRIYEPNSFQYDNRTRLQLMFDGTAALALGWYLTGRADFASHGAGLIRTCFLDPATRMNPHLGGCGSIIELKNLYYVLDAVRLLESSGAFGTEDTEALKAWLQGYLLWLETSKQGTKEMTSRDHHGSYFDLQTAAITAYLGERRKLRDIFLRAQCRIAQQFTEAGVQPEEMPRPNTQHCVFFNLQGWLCIFQIAIAKGLPIGDWTREPYSRIATAFRWIMRHHTENWPYQQIGHFDTDRVFPLVASALRLGLVSDDEITSRLGETRLHAQKPIFNPHGAVMPYWSVGLSANVAGAPQSA